MKKIIIFDLDGTLADGKHRLHLLPTTDQHLPRSWDKFNAAASGDSPIQDNIDLLISLYPKFKTIILTGRNEIAREATVEWLRVNGIMYDELIMRGYEDARKDVAFKEEVVKKLGIDNILCAFDDLPHVVHNFRSLGITTHQVTSHEDLTRTDLVSHGED